MYIVHFSGVIETVCKLSNSLQFIHQQNQSYFVQNFVRRQSLRVCTFTLSFNPSVGLYMSTAAPVQTPESRRLRYNGCTRLSFIAGRWPANER